MNQIQFFFIVLHFIMGVSTSNEMFFEEILEGLKNKTLTYLDVRNMDEIQNDGKVVGSVVVPRAYLTMLFKY